MPEDNLNEALRAFLGVGVFIGLGGIVLALIIQPNTPEHILSVCSAGMGTMIIVGVVIVKRLAN